MLRSLAMGLAVFGATGATGAMAVEKPPEILARSGKWLVNYDRDACHLAAQFGEGKNMVIAQFTRYEPGDHFDLALLGNRFFSDEAKVAGKVDFGLSDEPFAVNGLHGNVGKLKAIFLRSLRLDGWKPSEAMDVPVKLAPEQEARVTGVTVSIRGKRAVRLEFGSLEKPLAQMRLCMDNLVKNWGYDPGQQFAALRPVTSITSPGKWLSSGDYPIGAVMNGHHGLVQFRLDVDPEGKVVGCFILSRTSPDDFADITCRAMTKRARLQPALDERGKPMRSYYVNKVIWLAS